MSKYSSNDHNASEYEKDPRCSGDCEHCLNKIFDSESSYEFICLLDGRITYF